MGKAVRAVFCDSIELSGANWTNDLAVEFRRRRGYCRLRTTFRMRWTDWFSGKSLLIRQFKVNLFRTVVPNLVTPRLRFAGKFFADVASVDFTAGLSTKGPAAGVSPAR